MISFLQGLDDLKEVTTIMERLEDILDHNIKKNIRNKKRKLILQKKIIIFWHFLPKNRVLTCHLTEMMSSFWTFVIFFILLRPNCHLKKFCFGKSFLSAFSNFRMLLKAPSHCPVTYLLDEQ